MKARPIRYSPIGKQLDFQNSTAQNVLMTSGYGGGKTYSLCMKALKLAAINKGMAGGIFAPDYRMYKKDVVPEFKAILRANGIPYTYHKSEFIWSFPELGSTIWAFSCKDGDSIKGPNLAWGVINEVTLISQDAFENIIARIRVKDAKLMQLAMSGTPEQFNWVYEYFVETPREDTEYIIHRSQDNRFVHSSYFDRLKDSYDAKLLEQYLDGKFVNLQGNQCLHAFDRAKHTSDSIKHNPSLTVRISIDFNVTYMAATIFDFQPFYQSQDRGQIPMRYLGWDEVCLTGSNTFELGQTLKEKLNKAGIYDFDEQVTLYPDPAGDSRSTKSRNMTDIDILKEAGFNNIKFKPIKSVRNCINSTNALLKNNGIIFDKRKCPNAISDCEQSKWKNQSYEIDKSNPRRSHWVDGIKNMIDYEHPIRKPVLARTERVR